jgi:ankyrin repeat protein
VQALVDDRLLALTARTNDGWLPLHCAVCHGELTVVQWLANTTPSWNGTSPGGMLPLHLAASRARLVVVQWLATTSEATLGTPTTAGWLPIHFAARSAPTLEVVPWLASARPGTLEARTDRGMLPLHVAALSENSTLDVVYALARMSPNSI